MAIGMMADLPAEEVEKLLDGVELRVHEMTKAEGWEHFDRAARRYLHMSGEEFLEEWTQGKFDRSGRPEVSRVVMLLPFGGQQICR